MESDIATNLDDAGVVGEEAEDAGYGSGCVAYVYAEQPSMTEHSHGFSPDWCKGLMHLGVGFGYESFVGCCLDFGYVDLGVESPEEFVPHLNHRVRRAGDDEVYGFILEFRHLPGVGEDHSMMRLQYTQLFNVLLNICYSPLFDVNCK